MNEQEYNDLAEQLRLFTSKLEEINAPYNFYLHHSVEGDDLHFHVEIAPRISIWAGLELGSDIDINIIAPESAARFYRGEESGGK
jgi:UDPglucose--hexose-1-phosphate uridylyltransferase